MYAFIVLSFKEVRTMQERRANTRTTISHRVKLTHPTFGEIITTTNEMSNGGFFIELSGVPFPEQGSIIKMQLLDTQVEAVPTELEVIRVTAAGIGVAFKG